MSNYDCTSEQYNNPLVRGRSSLCYDQWVKLGVSGFVLSVVPDGCNIPFVALSPSKFGPKNASPLAHSHFVSQAISDLL